MDRQSIDLHYKGRQSGEEATSRRRGSGPGPAAGGRRGNVAGMTLLAPRLYPTESRPARTTVVEGGRPPSQPRSRESRRGEARRLGDDDGGGDDAVVGHERGDRLAGRVRQARSGAGAHEWDGHRTLRVHRDLVDDVSQAEACPGSRVTPSPPSTARSLPQVTSIPPPRRFRGSRSSRWT